MCTGYRVGIDYHEKGDNIVFARLDGVENDSVKKQHVTLFSSKFDEELKRN